MSQASFKAGPGGKAQFTRLLLSHFKQSSNLELVLLETTRTIRKKNYTDSHLSVKRWFDCIIRACDIMINMLWFKVKFVLLIIGKGPVAVQIHSSSGADFYDNSLYILLATLFHKPSILRIGGGDFAIFYSEAPALFQKYIHWIFSLTGKVICQSEYWQAFFNSTDLKKENIHIIPNFIDFSSWQVPHKRESSDIFRLLFMPGKNERVKGYYDVLPAVVQCMEQIPTLQLIVVGLQKKVEQHYQSFIEQKKIRICSVTDTTEKMRLFQSADVYLLPSYFEGFPNSLLEAMAAGLPIITSSIDSIRAIVKEEENALFVTPGDRNGIAAAITRLYHNSLLRETMSVNNKRLCNARFDIQKMSFYFTKLYEFEIQYPQELFLTPAPE